MSASPVSDETPQPSFTPHAQLVREPMFAENRAALEDLRDSIEAIDFRALDKARQTGQQYATVAAMTPVAIAGLPVRRPGATLRGRAPLLDATVGGPYEATPEPAVVPQPMPVAEPEPDGTWLLDFLELLLDDAAEGAGRRISEPCPSCPGTLSGWCDDCQDALARTAQYERLAELVEAAAGDRAAVLVLMAGEWRGIPEDAAVAVHCGTEDQGAAEVPA